MKSTHLQRSQARAGSSSDPKPVDSPRAQKGESSEPDPQSMLNNEEQVKRTESQSGPLAVSLVAKLWRVVFVRGLVRVGQVGCRLLVVVDRRAVRCCLRWAREVERLEGCRVLVFDKCVVHVVHLCLNMGSRC